MSLCCLPRWQPRKPAAVASSCRFLALRDAHLHAHTYTHTHTHHICISISCHRHAWPHSSSSCPCMRPRPPLPPPPSALISMYISGCIAIHWRCLLAGATTYACAALYMLAATASAASQLSFIPAACAACVTRRAACAACVTRGMHCRSGCSKRAERTGGGCTGVAGGGGATAAWAVMQAIHGWAWVLVVPAPLACVIALDRGGERRCMGLTWAGWRIRVAALPCIEGLAGCQVY